jgi:hypothetical protein
MCDENRDAESRQSVCFSLNADIAHVTAAPWSFWYCSQGRRISIAKPLRGLRPRAPLSRRGYRASPIGSDL